MDGGFESKKEKLPEVKTSRRKIDFVDKIDLFIAVPEIRDLLKRKVKEWQDEGRGDMEIIFLLGQVVGGVTSQLRAEGALDLEQVSKDIDVVAVKNKKQKPD